MMSEMNTEFGILTLATKNDYLKAIGLALSLRVSNPGVPTAIACSKTVGELVAPYFDFVIEEKPGLKGFVHKVYLDEYTPFKNTIFLDSDILVFKPLKPYVDAWSNRPYAAIGVYMAAGKSSFGLNRPAMMKKFNKDKMVEIGGAGHAAFYKPACTAVFDMAREVTANYKEIAGDIRYADEDVLNIVMTKMEIAPVADSDGDGAFLSRFLSAKRGTMQMDATKGICHYIYVDTGLKREPCIMHFAANEAPTNYTWQLFKLFRAFNVPTDGLLEMGSKDFYEQHIKLRLHLIKVKLMSLIGGK
jgi:hypothetical protein